MNSTKSIEIAKNPSEMIAPKKAVFLSKTEFRRAAETIYGKPVNECDLSKDLEYEEYLKNGSREMVKNWDNTIEKIRQRKVAALKKKEEQKKAEGLHQFRNMTKMNVVILCLILCVLFAIISQTMSGRYKEKR